jgi:hypothetical protein
MLNLDMSGRFVKKLLTVIILVPLFTGCGELDTVLPSSGTYQVKALVNETSMDDCSLVNTWDTVQPYFANSVANDPDITGLIVYLQNTRKEVLGKKVLYTLYPDMYADFEAGTGGEIAAADTGDENQEASKAAVVVKKNTLIPVEQMDTDLPEFPMPQNLAIGQYTLVFQVLGGKETLYQTEKFIYYLDDAYLILKEIQMYLPGVSAGSHVVQPGATIMLEARLDADPRLDPYIVWYNGKRLIGEGRLSEGAGSFLWQVPDQTGFHSLRAEAFPSRSHAGIAGSSREIAVPISSKATGGALVSGDSATLLHWYQFGGNLQDSKVSVPAGPALIPLGDKPARWRPIGYSYGLSAGPDSAYLIPPLAFFQDGENEGGGQFLFRFKPSAEGVILSAQFASAASTEALGMYLSLAGETLTLRLGGKDSAAVISAPIVFNSGDYITAAIGFSIESNRFEVTLNPVFESEGQVDPFADTSAAVQSYVMSISLTASLNGKCSLTLGASSSSTETTGAGITAIWDELVILR